jgi:DNA-binding transcriptional LysR family regulator
MDIESITRRLKLRELNVFLAVAKHGSMAKAAGQLAITQPVVSKSIADLEKTLGLRLFDRDTRGVKLTPYGLALLQRSRALFNDLRTSVTELQYLSDPAAGELRIGSSEAVAAGMLPAILNRLSRQYPRLVFDVTLGGDMAELPHHDLRQRNIDLIIGRLPPTLPEDIEATTLYNETLLILGGTANPLTRRRKVDLSELVDQFWCGPSFDNFPWSLMADAFRAKGFEIPRRVIRTRSIVVRNGLLASGRFLTVLPHSVLHFAGRDLGLKKVPLDLSVVNFPAGIVTLKGRTLNPAAQVFIDCAREIAKSFATA